MQTTISTFETTLQKSQQWMDELTEIGRFDDDEQSYAALRGVLQAIRDRITVDEAAHLGAQLPMLIRGMYYEGWSPSDNPQAVRNLDGFLKMVTEKMSGPTNIDPEQACRSVFKLLSKHLTEGEANHVREMMAKPIQELWP